MRSSWITGAIAALVLVGASAGTAQARGGCGPGFHRGVYGACRPNLGPRFFGPRFFGAWGYRRGFYGPRRFGWGGPRRFGWHRWGGWGGPRRFGWHRWGGIRHAGWGGGWRGGWHHRW